MMRYLYFLTEADHRLGKSVHFSKNVNTIFLHDVEEAVDGTWQLIVPRNSGHYVSHYRQVNNFYETNLNSSIKNLNIDFEYFYYWVYTFTDLCNLQPF